MHPHLKSLLCKAGCSPDASDDDAQRFYESMDSNARGQVDAELAQLMEGDAAGDDQTAISGGDTAETLSADQIADIAANAALAAIRKAGIGQQQAALSTTRMATLDGAVDDDEAAVKAEEKRVGNIRRLAKLHNVPEAEVNRIVAENGKIEDARTSILRYVHANAKPLASVTVGQDKQIAALRQAIPQALILRAGTDPKMFEKRGEKLHPEADRLRQQSMLDMFRYHLVALGVNPNEVYSLSRTALAGCLGPRGLAQRFGTRIAALAESTSDFANITLDAITKALRFNYLDARRTWTTWAEKKFAPDFKTINSIALSEAPSMILADEGAEMKYVTLTDSKETARLKTYKAGIRLTRNAIINDDLDAFNAIPRLQANSAARLEDDVAYALLTANGTMADTGALFNATATTTAGGHANYTASGSAPSVASLQTAATMMMKQKGLANAARLELEPKFLLVPTSIVEYTKELIGSDTLIAQYTGGSTNPLTVGNKNPFYNRYTVVGSTRLDDASTTAWYTVADYRDGQINTFQLFFLTDEPEPVLRQETDFDTEDVKYLVRHTVVGLVPDFRGVYKNNGQ